MSQEQRSPHRVFAREYVTSWLAPEHKTGVLSSLLSEQGINVHQFGCRGVWEIMSLESSSEQSGPPEDLFLSVFKTETCFCFPIQLPKARHPGDAQYGMIVWGPCQDLEAEDRKYAPVRYLICDVEDEGYSVLEWRSSRDRKHEFQEISRGHHFQTLRDFVDHIIEINRLV